MVTKFVPSPPDSGGKKRSWAEAVRLVDLGPLTLLAFEDGHPNLDELSRRGIDARGFPRPSGLLSAGNGLVRTQSVTAARFWSARLAAALRSLAAEPVDVLLVVHAQMAPYARFIPARHRVLDLQNVESSLIDSYGKTTSGLRSLAAGGEAWALRRLERRALAVFDTVLTVSERDRDRLPAARGEIVVCRNGTDLGPILPPAQSPVAVFVALMGWTPNADAARFLVERVWPEVRTRVRGARLCLVGRGPTPVVQAFAGPDIEVTGRVDSVQPYLQQARVALAPLLCGGGSRLKILEALGAGRPVVATTIGAEGLEDLIGQGVLIADTPVGLAEHIAGLLVDPARSEALGRVGHAAVAARYGWDATLAPLVDRVRSWTTGDGA